MPRNLLFLALLGLVLAFPDDPLEAAPNAQVTFWTEGDWRYCESNGLPDHAPGKFPNRRNPNSIAPQRHFFRMPRRPRRSLTPIPVAPAIFGVALNGVPFDPGTAERRGPLHYEALGGTIDLGLDRDNAHVQPSGTYHYHGMPFLLVARLGSSGRMTLLGYAADGFPIYNDRDREGPRLASSFRLRPTPRSDGSRPDGTFTEDYEWQEGELDLCNGHWGRTPEFPQGIYHYHLTESFPFVPRWFAGAPDPSFARR